MNNIGIEQHPVNSHREPMIGVSHFEASREPSATREQAPPGRQASAAQKDDASIDSILKFAKNIQAKAKDVPYLVPVAIGGTAFVLGVLASSRILRQVVLMAGSYAVKYAIQNAPRDEILGFAKKVMSDSFRASHA